MVTSINVKFKYMCQLALFCDACVSPVSAKERFRLIKCPTLILSGEKALEPLEKAGLAKAENQSWLQEVIPHSQKVELESGTLWMINQMPEEVLKVVVDF